MPELPEVETIRRSLAEHVTGLRIKKVQLIWPGAVKGWQDHDFKDVVTDRQIEMIERRGKYLLIRLDQDWTMVAHMRMTGRLVYLRQKTEPVNHTHVIFELEHGELHFADQRKFGRMQIVPTSDCVSFSGLALLGPEPLAENFTAQILGERLAGKKTNIKAALLDQRVLAGLGNIYTDESLFRASILPERAANFLSGSELSMLHQEIQAVLKEGIAAQGTSFRDYRDANGDKGSFQSCLQVYGRAGEPCRKCGNSLAKKRIAGRTTVFCPHCQH